MYFCKKKKPCTVNVVMNLLACIKKLHVKWGELQEDSIAFQKGVLLWLCLHVHIRKNLYMYAIARSFNKWRNKLCVGSLDLEEV